MRMMGRARKGFTGFILIKIVEVLVPAFLLTLSAHAADDVASSDDGIASSDNEVTLDQVRELIEAETDPELRAEMEAQLHLMESGQLDVHTIERELVSGAPSARQDAVGGPRSSDGLLVGPPIEIGMTGGATAGNYLPPEARAELEQLFQQGTGDPSQDGHLREQAEQIMEKYGIERPAEGMEGRGEFEHGGNMERAMEQMGAETREQTEHQMERMEREFGGPPSERSVEAPTREYEAPTHEYEARSRESEAPQHEQDMPMHEPQDMETYQGEAPH